MSYDFEQGCRRKTIIIKSSDKVQGTSSSGNIILQHELNGTYILEHFVMINALYNVNDQNNKVYADIAANPTETFTLTNGSYTRSQLATELQTQLATSVNWAVNPVVSIDLKTLRYTVDESGGGTNFQIMFGTNTANSARLLLGFSEADTSAATSASSDQASDTSPIKYVFMNIKQSNSDLFESKNYFTSTFAIYDKESSFGENLRYVRKFGELKQVLDARNMRNFKYKFVDQNCEEVDFNGCEWSLMLSQKI